MRIPEPFPWQREAWRKFADGIGRFPHAAMIEGPAGSGRSHFAVRIAAALACMSQDGRPCGSCRSCGLFAAATHPDFHLVSTEKAHAGMEELIAAYAKRHLGDSPAASRANLRSSILIDQVRSLIDSASTKPHISHCKVFGIYPADSMNVNASNSLLKILEEPADDTYLILITDDARALLPTIASRCQKIAVPAPDDSQAAEWLAQQGVGMDDAKIALSLNPSQPLVALEKVKSGATETTSELLSQILSLLKGRSVSVTRPAAAGVKAGEKECLYRLQQLAGDLIRLNMRPAAQNLSFGFMRESLAEQAQRMDARKLLEFYDYVGELRSRLSEVALDKTLVIEDALLKFREMARNP